MKYLKTYEDIINNSVDKFKTGDVFFHGTTLSKIEKIQNDDYEVEDFYITTSQENAKAYAHKNGEKENSDAVFVVLNYEFLDGEIINKEDNYIFNGNIKKAIYLVDNLITKSVITDYNQLSTGVKQMKGIIKKDGVLAQNGKLYDFIIKKEDNKL
jgi:hypothetical protein